MAGRSIPACAGEAIASDGALDEPEVYPRVRGGSGAYGQSAPPSRGLSPRVRGKHKDLAAAVAAEGSIPACAGEA